VKQCVKQRVCRGDALFRGMRNREITRNFSTAVKLVKLLEQTVWTHGAGRQRQHCTALSNNILYHGIRCLLQRFLKFPQMRMLLCVLFVQFRQGLPHAPPHVSQAVDA
jgi:hypothetical protein